MRTAKLCGPGVPVLALRSQRCSRVVAGDGGKNAGPRGERRVSRSNHRAGKAGYFRLSLWFLPRAFFPHGGHGYQSIPGLPCALSF
jgi:hypothetical protein